MSRITNRVPSRFNRGDLATASTEYRRAYWLARLGFPRAGGELAANLIALATVASAERRYHRAQVLAERGLQAARRSGDRRHAVAACRLLANLVKDDGRYEEALEHLADAESLVDSGNMIAERPSLELTRGWIAYNRSVLADGPSAVPSFERALREAESLAHRHQTLEARLGLVSCALAVGDRESAATAFSALSNGEALPEHKGLAAMKLIAAAAVLHQQEQRAASRAGYERLRRSARGTSCWRGRPAPGSASAVWRGTTGTSSKPRRTGERPSSRGGSSRPFAVS